MLSSPADAAAEQSLIRECGSTTYQRDSDEPDLPIWKVVNFDIYDLFTASGSFDVSGILQVRADGGDSSGVGDPDEGRDL